MRASPAPISPRPWRSPGLFLEARLASAPQLRPARARHEGRTVGAARQALAAWLAGAPRTPSRAPGRSAPAPLPRGGRPPPPPPPSTQPAATPQPAGGCCAHDRRPASAGRDASRCGASGNFCRSPPCRPAPTSRWRPSWSPAGCSRCRSRRRRARLWRNSRSAAIAEQCPRARSQPGGSPFPSTSSRLGPIHARISLRGGHATVGLWAENDIGLARLRQDEALLGQALARTNIAAEIGIHAGHPPVSAPEAGRLVDQTS
jgi:hypothetical protein